MKHPNLTKKRIEKRQKKSPKPIVWNVDLVEVDENSDDFDQLIKISGKDIQQKQNN